MTNTVSSSCREHKTRQELQETWLKYLKLENVAINDVLPLKAARRDAIANLP